MRIYLRYILITLMFFISIQCSRIPETHYYLIDYPIEPSQENAQPIYNVILGVARFKADPLYDQTKLVYREAPYEGKYYHRWITTPAEMVTDKVIEQLSHSDLFRNVLSFPRFTQVDFVLTGKIKAIEEWDQGNQWFARVRIRFELLDKTGSKLIWQTDIEKQNLVGKKTPADVVKCINNSVQQCVVDLQQKLKEVLAEAR